MIQKHDLSLETEATRQFLDVASDHLKGCYHHRTDNTVKANIYIPDNIRPRF
jgi:hypothetical protein